MQSCTAPSGSSAPHCFDARLKPADFQQKKPSDFGCVLDDGPGFRALAAHQALLRDFRMLGVITSGQFLL